MKFLFQIILVFILALLMLACSDDKKSNVHTMIVSAKPISNTLFYTGTIQPIKSLVVPSPVDGVVIDMPFQYGEPVIKNNLLFMISSEKFLSDYKTALMQYIKAKNEFNNNQTQLTESKFLHKNELISDDDFKMKQSNYYASQLALLQAKDGLEILLHQLDIKNVDLYKLTIADIDKITQAMNLQMSAEKNLRILAPTDGIVLSASKGEEENKRISKGDAVKQGDVLAVIGDMKGISVRIKVNELTINQLKVGQKVKITGIAFPEHILQGQIRRADRQGETANGGLPTFIVEVAVPMLTESQQKQIHVGMSAKVEIDLQDEPQMLVPLAALQEKQGDSFIEIYNASTKKNKLIAVRTGKTTLDSVAILSGLKEGDQIVIPN